jgi:hypothetical protein
MPIQDQFPSLFFDVKTVEQKTVKPLPSMGQVLAAVLVANGIPNQGLASELATAAEELVSLRSKA